MRLFGKVDSMIDNYDRPFFFGGPFDRFWYHIFPSLTYGPNSDEFVEETPFDSTIRSQFENGTILTRARFTTVPKIWNITIDYLTETDKLALDSFQRNEVNFGASIFSWHNTQDGVTYRVRFVEPVKFIIKPRTPNATPNTWRAEFKLFTS